MKLVACAWVAMSVGLAFINPADAKDCIKAAIAGGVAGHMAGHHGVVGAAVGCEISHHEANKHQDNTENR